MIFLWNKVFLYIYCWISSSNCSHYPFNFGHSLVLLLSFVAKSSWTNSPINDFVNVRLLLLQLLLITIYQAIISFNFIKRTAIFHSCMITIYFTTVLALKYIIWTTCYCIIYIDILGSTNNTFDIMLTIIWICFHFLLRDHIWHNLLLWNTHFS